MQVSYREYARCILEIRTHLGPQVDPAVERGPKKGEGMPLHLLVLELEIGRDEPGVLREPGLVAIRSGVNVRRFH